MTVRMLVGDCRVLLPTLPERSVQSTVTSVPYWGLRDYGTPPLVWGGEPGHEHEWQAAHTAGWHVGTATGVATSTLARSAAEAQARNKASITGTSMGRACSCGAWLGQLGLEPTPELYIEHIVECFRHVWRVLTDDGTAWLNCGDSYAGSGKGPTGHNGIGDQVRRQGFKGGGYQSWADRSLQPLGPGRAPIGYKPKDLLMIPFRVAMALQADGWYLRSCIPWLKRNSMPESVSDRPASAVEYVFLLAKSRRYYWDAAAVRHAVGTNTHSRGDGLNPKAIENPDRQNEIKQNVSFSGAINMAVESRNRRNSDWFVESWQGLLLDEQDEPLALVVNPAPYKGAHYATFPPKLVEPMLKASTRPGDTVLDPFAGSGTVGMVADRLGRNAVLCELSGDYGDQAIARVSGDAPLFTEVDVA